MDGPVACNGFQYGKCRRGDCRYVHKLVCKRFVRFGWCDETNCTNVVHLPLNTSQRHNASRWSYRRHSRSPPRHLRHGRGRSPPRRERKPQIAKVEQQYDPATPAMIAPAAPFTMKPVLAPYLEFPPEITFMLQ